MGVFGLKPAPHRVRSLAREGVAGPAGPEPGTAPRYTLTVTNAGPVTATAVELVDTLPSSVDYVSAVWPAGPAASAPASSHARFMALAPGATAPATVTVRTLRGGTLAKNRVGELGGCCPPPR
jgi:uncharacterized repeat protein (TIGR01451 family)